MTGMRDTIPLRTSEHAATVPLRCVEAAVYENRARMRKGQLLGEYRLLGLMKVTLESELWYAQSPSGAQCVVKIIALSGDRELLIQLQMMRHEHLAQLLEFGLRDGWHYEIYPFYRQGIVTGPQKEETIRKIILPSLIGALAALHEEGIMHNDIKPENLFWNDRRDGVLLGDFGSACKKGRRPDSITPSFSAPELLLGDASRRSSDWCSVGLTLAALSLGTPLLKSGSIKEALGEWEHGVRFQEGSSLLRQLINGMVNPDYRKRLGPKAAQRWCDEKQFGGESRKSLNAVKEKQPITIVFENPKWIAADIPTLLRGIQEHWDFSVFLFREGKFDVFLSQFERGWLSRCKQLRKRSNAEDGLYQLTLELTGQQSFLWRAVEYTDLLSMEAEWKKGGTSRENVLTFLQRGLVGVYLAQSGGDEKQMEYVRKLQALSHYNPDEACMQLFQGLIGDSGYKRGEVRLQNLSDLVNWLQDRVETLDQDVDALMRDSTFCAWLSFQGLGDVVEQIERKMGV